jgi:hypothetical protein
MSGGSVVAVQSRNALYWRNVPLAQSSLTCWMSNTLVTDPSHSRGPIRR